MLLASGSEVRWDVGLKTASVTPAEPLHCRHGFGITDNVAVVGVRAVGSAGQPPSASLANARG